ncbi:MAG: hypothetical protein HC888_14625 [Candidatus Competibacteraceae bacterium]|nr:hypothetical protein [Candidatus Competibacteraceae bacterium]
MTGLDAADVLGQHLAPGMPIMAVSLPDVDVMRHAPKLQFLRENFIA